MIKSWIPSPEPLSPNNRSVLAKTDVANEAKVVENAAKVVASEPLGVNVRHANLPLSQPNRMASTKSRQPS